MEKSPSYALFACALLASGVLLYAGARLHAHLAHRRSRSDPPSVTGQPRTQAVRIMFIRDPLPPVEARSLYQAMRDNLTRESPIASGPDLSRDDPQIAARIAELIDFMNRHANDDVDTPGDPSEER